MRGTAGHVASCFVAGALLAACGGTAGIEFPLLVVVTEDMPEDAQTVAAVVVRAEGAEGLECLGSEAKLPGAVTASSSTADLFCDADPECAGCAGEPGCGEGASPEILTPVPLYTADEAAAGVEIENVGAGPALVFAEAYNHDLLGIAEGCATLTIDDDEVSTVKVALQQW